MTCKIKRRDCKYCSSTLECVKEKISNQGNNIKGKCNEITKENFKRNLLQVEEEFGFVFDSIFVS